MAHLPGIRRLLRLPSAERDVTGAVDDELSFHVDMLTEQLIAEGQPPQEARMAAMRRFGDIDDVRRRCYDISSDREAAVRRAELWGSWWQDIKYAARGLRRAPGFSLVVLLTLALGIGASTAMFSVVRGVLLRPLPYPDAERVVRIWPVNQGAGKDRGDIGQTEFEDWKRELTQFEAIGAFRTFETGTVYGETQDPEYVPSTYVTDGFFGALGTHPELGRTFQPEEHVRGTNSAVVVSHGFWQHQLGADPRVVGHSITLDGKLYNVVGVMPRDFAFPNPSIAVWVSASLLDSNDVGPGRDSRWMQVVGRLRPGVDAAQGRAQVDAFLTRLAAAYPASNAGWTSSAIENVRDSIVGPVRRGLLVLLGAVGMVLLVVCVNVANLLLVRGTARERELALRAAIGAGRARIVRLLLTESLLLALVGGLLGVLTAWWGVHTLVALSGQFLPRAADIRLDAGVVTFAVLVSVLTGILFGLWPALRSSTSTGSASTLREDARGSVGSATANRARSALVTMEVALAVVLVVGAGLMLRSFQRLTAADPGFRAENVLLLRFRVPEGDPSCRATSGCPGSEGGRGVARNRARVLERVGLVPGVLSVGATKNAPLTTGQGEPIPFTVPGQTAPAPGQEPRVMLQPASRGYLRTMGIPLVTGQDLSVTAGDTTSGITAVISRRMAEASWPGRSPVGETFMLGKSPVRIVGVAGDVRATRLDSAGGFVAYLPDRVMPRTGMSLVVRTAGDPARLAAPVRAAVREVFPGQAFQEVTPLRTKLSDATSTQRFFTVLVAVFGTLALALAAVGLYGVVSYTVRQREREMAVRLALGAPPLQVMQLMLRQGMTPVVIGLAVGLVGAFTVTRIMRSLLYEVSTTDPATFLVVAALLGGVALIASYLPSRRAARVDPAITLRAE